MGEVKRDAGATHLKRDNARVRSAKRAGLGRSPALWAIGYFGESGSPRGLGSYAVLSLVELVAEF